MGNMYYGGNSFSGNSYDAGMNGGMGSMGGVLSFMDSWPAWAVTLATLLIIVVCGWVIGKIVGTVYATIKFPDPNKTQIFSPKQKVVFLSVIALVVGMIYFALQPEKPIDDMLGDDMYGDGQGQGQDQGQGNNFTNQTRPSVGVTREIMLVG